MGKKVENHKMIHRGVDEQHAKVFAKIRKLGRSIQSMNSARAVFHRLFSLARYAEKHFSHEEHLMFVSGYRQYHLHKQQHGEFIRKIGEIKSAYHDDHASPDLPGHVQRSLGEWLDRHVKHEDAAVVAWVNDKARRTRPIMRGGL
ncbi:MAG: hemerythrin domain-containing protein [Magnetococcus sp. DMHC-8]